MKTNVFITKLLGLTLCMLLLAPAALMAQDKMPITTSSEEAREVFIEGRDQLEMLNIAKSTELLKRAVELDPEFAMAYLFLSFSEGGGTGFAPEPLNKAIDFSHKVSEGERQMIHLIKAMQAGNEKAGEIHREALLKLHPQDERIQLWSGYSLYFQEENRKALPHFKKAERLNEAFHPAYNILGYTYMNLGKTKKAERHFKAYLRILPDAANPHDSYAEFLRKEGRFDEAIEHYKKAIAYSPGFLASHKGLADSYLFKGEYGLAREQYRNYCKHTSNKNSQFNSLLWDATLDLHENKPESALRVMDQYIDLAEELELPYYKIYGRAYMAGILNETGQPEKAIRLYREAIKKAETEDMDENIRMNLKTLGHLWEFYALASNGDMDDAEAARTQCHEMVCQQENPYHHQVYNAACGIMEIKKGDYRQARKHLSKAYEGAFTWYYMGLAWEKSGKDKKARDWYEKVANHYNNSIELGIFRNKAMAGLEE